MESDFLKMLIDKCLDRGFDYAEATLQKAKQYKSGFELEYISNEEITNNFLHLKIVHDESISSANFAIDETEDIDLLIDLTRSNTIRVDKKGITKMIDDDVSDIFNSDPKISKKYDFENNKLLKWVKTESDLITEKIGFPIVGITFQYEEGNVFLKKSTGKKGFYSYANSSLSGAINISLEDKFTNLLPFSKLDVAPYSYLYNEICSKKLLEELTRTPVIEFEKLEGITEFSKDAVSFIMSGIANSLNSELLIADNSFLKISDINKTVFDPCFSLYDNPLVKKGGRAFFPFDFEGTTTKKKCLIKNGKIIDLLCDKQRTISIAGVTAGNSYRICPNIKLKTQHSNLILNVEKPISTSHEVENFIDTLGMQSFFDASNGKIKGMVSGRKKTGNIMKQVNFTFDIFLKNFLKEILACHSYGWRHGNYVPIIIVKI